MTLDDACAYARAKRDTVIRRAEAEDGAIRLTLGGTAAEPVQAYVFRDAGDEIESCLVDVAPAASNPQALVKPVWDTHALR